MGTLCNRLSLFLDGELPPVDEENFRHHLARCDPCASGLHEAMQLELLGFHVMGDPRVLAHEQEDAPETWTAPDAPRTRDAAEVPGRPHWRWAPFAVGAVAAAIVLVLVVKSADVRGSQQEVWLAQTSSRLIEARVAYARADGHRPYVPLRAGVRGPPGGAGSALPLRALADLEDQGDLHGIAAAYLVRRDLRQASDFLHRMSPSPDRDSDLAIIALEQGHPEQALALLDGVLRQAPEHAQAQWNRALVLREMGLTLLAAEAFDAVVKRGEPGWSEEARIRARALRQQTQARGRAWKGARAAVRDLMVDAQARLPLEEAKRFPGIVRLAFYDAVRAAPSREGTLRLLPLADVLDGVQGGEVLRGYVQRVAERDFSRRAPLAADYAKLVRGELSSPARFLETLRRSGEDDLYLGGLINQKAGARHLEDFTRLARAAEDPWLSLLAERELAGAEERAGEWWKAEARLRAAVGACQGKGLSYRCATLKKRLSDLYLALNRPAEAFEQAWSGWLASREQEEWELEQQFLQELAHIARYRLDITSARAYLRESLARTPDACEQRTYVHRNLAYLSWLEFDAHEARNELELAQECGRPLGLPGALLLSYRRASARTARTRTCCAAPWPSCTGGSPPRASSRRCASPRGSSCWSATARPGWSCFAAPSNWRRPFPTMWTRARRAWGPTTSWRTRQAARTPQVRPWRSWAPRFRSRSPRDVCWASPWTTSARWSHCGALRVNCRALRRQPRGALGRDASGLVPPSLQAALKGCERVDVLALPPVHGLRGCCPRSSPGATAWGGPEARLPCRLVAAGRTSWSMGWRRPRRWASRGCFRWSRRPRRTRSESSCRACKPRQPGCWPPWRRPVRWKSTRTALSAPRCQTPRWWCWRLNPMADTRCPPPGPRAEAGARAARASGHVQCGPSHALPS
ncbi:tetratricopeptide repeat protein [Myxococcus sp. MxC21-1]|uniref:tetratricopeptide repeat protein n=1 Tax=Myxococcus sp. MxC21-1 TaxID=3041439 RepID=UPI00292DF118|nr:tetratricopeptide repeat protein [Myxococcus sp. MxC21-1]WNZ66042.1 tetratricopeptide repeat protein [Myxococcus sp. MxC21-1]